MPDFQEIEDIRELQNLSDELNSRLRRLAPHRRTRTVGYPSGHEDFPIQSAAKAGPAVTWWSSKKAPSGDSDGNEERTDQRPLMADFGSCQMIMIAGELINARRSR